MKYFWTSVTRHVIFKPSRKPPTLRTHVVLLNSKLYNRVSVSNTSAYGRLGFSMPISLFHCHLLLPNDPFFFTSLSLFDSLEICEINIYFWVIAVLDWRLLRKLTGVAMLAGYTQIRVIDKLHFLLFLEFFSSSLSLFAYLMLWDCSFSLLWAPIKWTFQVIFTASWLFWYTFLVSEDDNIICICSRFVL